MAGLEGLRTVDLAARLLSAAGVTFRPGEEDARAVRIDLRLVAGYVMRGFSPDATRRGRGWGVALAGIIDELEQAGLRPGDLAQVQDERARGVAQLWAALDEEAGTRWTRARIVAEATAHAHATASVTGGPVVAIVNAATPRVDLRLLAAIAGVRLVILRARPIDDAVRERFASALGLDAAKALEQPPTVNGETALARLQRADRRRGAKGGSSMLDRSLDLEQHSGVEREVDAAARWVAEQIHAGVPLEEIAVLSTESSPYPELLHERIRSIAGDESVPVYVATGLSLPSAPGGACVLAVLRALARHLDADAMWDLLPLLRLAPRDAGETHGPRVCLSRADAFEIAHRLGTTGGHALRPEGARDWLERTRTRIARLSSASTPEPEHGDGARGSAPTGASPARRLSNLLRIVPALESLDRVAASVLEGSTITQLAAALQHLFTEHVVQRAREPARLFLQAVIDQDLPAALEGSRAVTQLVELARTMRLPTCRFGEPAVFVGSLADADGLRFRSVRIVGLVEGTVPPRPRPDVVLAEDVRAQIGLMGERERSSATRRRFDAAVMAASERLALSCPAVAIDRAARAPSPVLIDAIATVTAAGDPLRALEEAFAGSRERAEHDAAERPLRCCDELERAAQVRGAAPAASVDADPSTRDRGPTNSLDPEGLARLDGMARAPAGTSAIGLEPSTPISVTALKVLLQCPHRFFVSSHLRWGEPLVAPEPGTLSALHFGTAVHTSIERFFRAHGPAFEGRADSLEDHLAAAEAIVAAVLGELRETHALAHDRAWQAELTRARDHVRAFLEHEWYRPRGRFVAVERSFGTEPDGAVELRTSGGSIWVRGAIDRIRLGKRNKPDDVAEVWDIKSGKNKGEVKPDTEPDARIDLQIGVYLLVARALQQAWKLPVTVAAGYVHTDHAKGPERWFDRDRADALGFRALRWLEVARGLLAAGVYPRTPDREDCEHCHLRGACGPSAPLQAARLLRRTSGPLREFARFKGLEVDTRESHR